MIVYIFPGQVPNVNIALAADGTVLDVFGDEAKEEMAAKYKKEYTVEFVDAPHVHKQLQVAIDANAIRTSLASEDPTAWAETELFRWQYDELPKKDDTRKLDVVKAVRTMAVGTKQGNATRENIAMVLVYLAALLPTLGDDNDAERTDRCTQ